MVNDFQDQVRWEFIDLLESLAVYDLIEGYDYVFHGAAMVSFDPGDRKRMYRINVEGTANIVNACLEHGVKRLIHISSIAALGRDKKDHVINENTEWSDSNLNNDYGKSKMLSELEVWRGYGEGLDVVIGNPALVIGSGDWNRSSLQVFDRISKGIYFYPSGGNGIVDVRDVVDGLISMAHLDQGGQRFILSAENHSYKDFFTTIAKVMNVSTPKMSIPGWMKIVIPPLERVRAFILRRPPIITRSSLRSISHYSRYDNSRSVEKLGLSYRSIDQSIKESVETYLQGGMNPLFH